MGLRRLDGPLLASPLLPLRLTERLPPARCPRRQYARPMPSSSAALATPTTPEPMSAPPVRWGVLAPGGIANRFADAVREGTASTVVAVGSPSPGRAVAFA